MTSSDHHCSYESMMTGLFAFLLILIALTSAEYVEPLKKERTYNKPHLMTSSSSSYGGRYRHTSAGLTGNDDVWARSTNFDVAERYDDGVCELEINCQLKDGNMTQPIRLPFKGPRGPRGQQGQKGDRGDVGKPGPPGPPGDAASTVHRVAFFVGLMDNLGPIASHADIVFDGIVTNVGFAYDPETGRFNAPVNGTYQFNVVVAAQGRQRAAVMVLNNGNQVVTVWAESIPYWSTSSNIVILSLTQGDQVWLVLLNKASFLHGYMYTTFSGFLLF